MKKIILGVITSAIILGSSLPAMAENNNSDITWVLEHSVDDFGDESGNSVIQCTVNGKFSNTATMDEELKVVTYILSDDEGTLVGKGNYALAFRLFEYGDHVATYTSSEEKILKTKIGDNVEEYELLGSAPNGDLYVDFIGNDLNTKEGLQDYAQDNNKNYGEAIAKQLLDGNEIKCVIKIGSSKYNFTLEAGNIKDTFDELMEDGEHELPQDIEGQAQKREEQKSAEVNQQVEEYCKSTKNLIQMCIEKDDSFNRNLVLSYLENHCTEYPALTQEEVTNIFPGTYLMFSIFQKRGEYYTYDESGNRRFMGVLSNSGFKAREEWNPNYEEIAGSWNIEGDKFNMINKYQETTSYTIYNSGYEGYYFASGGDLGSLYTVLLVRCDENYQFLYSLPDE